MQFSCVCDRSNLWTARSQRSLFNIEKMGIFELNRHRKNISTLKCKMGLAKNTKNLIANPL